MQTSSPSMIKLVWNAANATTKRGSLLRRVSPRPLAPTTNAIDHFQTRSKSSLHEAPLLLGPSSFSPLGDYEANKYGYRVVVNRSSSSSLRRMDHSYHHYDAGLNDDYDDYAVGHSSSRNAMIMMENENLDILASPEVQEILQSQRDWDSSLKEHTMMVKGESLQDTILDGGEYDSDYEEMSPADWDDNTNKGSAAAAEDCWDAEEFEDN